MKPERMASAEEIKAKADQMELAGVDFLDKNGNYCSGGRADWKQVRSIRLKFIDGEWLYTTPGVFTSLGDYKFRLRPPDHG